MPDAIKHPSSETRRRGVALLMVLFILMAVTVISVGILARGDVELSCGQNMTLRVQMDQMAASGLEHARGLVLNPQEVSDEYWAGADNLQLDSSSSDFYDVSVSLDGTDPNDRCNYTVECKAYRVRGEDEVGCSGLSAQLRLDPCIAFWASADTTVAAGLSVHGDVRCGGDLLNYGSIDGDVFATSLTPEGSSVTGRLNPQSLSLVWPAVTETDFTDASRYIVDSILTGTLVSDLGPYDPPHVFRRESDLVVSGGVTVTGMLLVDGDLTLRGDGVTLVAAKNMPALYVTGNLIVEAINDLHITGLVVVDGDARISAGASGIRVLGGVALNGTLIETTPDSSGNRHDLLVYGAPAWQTASGQIGGALEFDGEDDVLEDPSAGAYLNGRSAITVSLWVKSDVTYVDRGIMFTCVPDGGDEELGFRYDQVGSHWPWPRSCIKASIRTTSGYTQIESSAYVQSTSWQHLALVWQAGRRLKLYINGNPDPLGYDGDVCFGTIAGVQKLMLGLDTKNKHWDGLIDDVRIYTQAFSDAEVLNLQQGILAGLPNPIAHWALDEGGVEGDITADPAKAAIVVWSGGNREHWSPAAGAFFKAICREQF